MQLMRCATWFAGRSNWGCILIVTQAVRACLPVAIQPIAGLVTGCR